MRGRGAGHEGWGPLWNKEVRPVCVGRESEGIHDYLSLSSSLIQTLQVVVAFLDSSFLEGICLVEQLGGSCDQEGVGLDFPKESTVL